MEITPSPFGKTLVIGEAVDGAVVAERKTPLPFDDFTFVAIFDPDVTPEMIEEYHRVLKYNGKLSISVRQDDEGRILKEMTGFQIYHRSNGNGVRSVNLNARKT